MTSIRALPEAQSDVSIETAVDWLDALAFTDPAGNAIPLDGIFFHLQVRVTAADNEIFFEGTTTDGTLVIVACAATVAIDSPGENYAIGDLIHAPLAGAIVPMTLKVTAIGGSGTINSAIVVDPGIYSTIPANPITQAFSSGAGSGGAFDLTWINNGLSIAVPAALLPGKFVAGTYVYGIQMMAEGYTETLISGALNLINGVVR